MSNQARTIIRSFLHRYSPDAFMNEDSLLLDLKAANIVHIKAGNELDFETMKQLFCELAPVPLDHTTITDEFALMMMDGDPGLVEKTQRAYELVIRRLREKDIA